MGIRRRQADTLAGVLIAGILLVGVVSTVQLLLADDAMMGAMDSVPVIHYVGPLLGSLVIGSILGGVYLVVRDRLFSEMSEVDRVKKPTGSATEIGEANGTDEVSTATREPMSGEAIQHHILDVLPDDERKILKPVVESPGLTQIQVRDRSGFSRSKVSQTVTDLEDRGLLYRERQGRTYRVYPADDLDERV